MPFVSDKQRRFLFENKPSVANKFVAHAKAMGVPATNPSPYHALTHKLDSYAAPKPVEAPVMAGMDIDPEKRKKYF